MKVLLTSRVDKGSEFLLICSASCLLVYRLLSCDSGHHTHQVFWGVSSWGGEREGRGGCCSFFPASLIFNFINNGYFQVPLALYYEMFYLIYHCSVPTVM